MKFCTSGTGALIAAAEWLRFVAVHESGYGTKLLNARALVCPEELAKADMPPFS
jgi:hypothetical protein